MKLIIILMALVFLFSPGINAQAIKVSDLDAMEASYQGCLDEGKQMLKCAQSYYGKMDSMLNVAYKQLRVRMNESQKNGLKKDQIAWLRKRDKFFNILPNEVKKEGLAGDDYLMVVFDKKAEFVKDRTILLLQLW